MITYLIEVSICWLLFYSIYILLLRKETFFNINRWYLLSTLVLGLLIPLFTVDFSSLFYQEPTSSVTYLAEGFSELEYVIEASVEEAKTTHFSWLTLAMLIYGLGVIATFCRFVYGFRQIYGLYKEGNIIKKGNYNLVLTKTHHLPFSFFNYLFWNEETTLEDKDSGKIITHELAHINQWHSLDVLFLEFLGIALWFSPPIYWYKKSLRTVHEYLADAYVLRDTKKKQYGHLLIRQVQSGMQVALANNFIHSQLKQRINMMTRNKSRRKALTRYLPALPLLLLMVLVFSNKNVQNNFNETTVKAGFALGNVWKEDFDLIKVKARMQIAYRDGSKGWFTESGETMDWDAQKMKELDRESKRLIAKYPEEEATIVMLTMEVAAENGYRLNYVGKSMRYREIENFEKGEEIKMIMDNQKLSLPLFEGGKDKIREFIYDNIAWPAIIEKERIYGLVNATFLVDKDGEMTNLEITSNLDESINNEVMRVLELMQAQPTKWTPAKINGEAVDMTYDLPFNIRQEGYDTNGVWFDKGEKIKEGLTWNYFSGLSEESSKKEEVFNLVDSPPIFPGGEKEMLHFIYRNIKYPAEARGKGIYGNLMAQFDVEKDGRITNLKVTDDLGGGLSEEVVRVLKLVQEMPEKWTPATKDGVAFRSTYKLPFAYQLEVERADGTLFSKKAPSLEKGAKIVIVGLSKIPKKEIHLVKTDENGVKHYETVGGKPNKAEHFKYAENGEKLYKVADEMPRFPGCETTYSSDAKSCADRKMLQFIYENIEYPAVARKEGIEGTIVIRFLVGKDGSINDAEIVRNVGGGTGEEALRVVNLMKEMPEKWIPGRQDNENVSVYFNLPVKFKLSKEAKEALTKTETDNSSEKPKDLLKRGLPEENVTLQLGKNTLTLNAFPNPAKEKLTITLEGKAKDILVTVFDVTGKEYFRDKVQAFEGTYYKTIDLENAPTGTLIVNVRHKGKDYQKKVIVQ